MPSSLFGEILKRLKGASESERSQFMREVIADKNLYDALRKAGIEHYGDTLDPSEGRERAVSRPLGGLSTVQKLDLIDKITEVGLIDLITEVSTIKTIDTIQQIRSIESADMRTGLIRNPSFETGNLNGWRVVCNAAGSGSYEVTDTVEGGVYKPWQGNYALKLVANNPATGIEPEIGQRLPFVAVEDIDYLAFPWFANSNRKLCCDVYYTDDTRSTFEFTASLLWLWKHAVIKGAQLTAGKTVYQFGIYPKSESPLNDGASFYVDDADVRLVPMLGEIGTIQPFSIAATGDLKTPATGKKLQILDFYYYSTVAGVTELRFKTSGNLIGGLPDKGACGFNKVRRPFWIGAADERVEGYLSGAGAMKGYFTCKEV